MEPNRRGVILANLHHKGLVKGRKVKATTTKSGDKILINTSDLGDKRLVNQGKYRYNPELQENYPAPGEGTVIIAPCGNFVHFFLIKSGQSDADVYVFLGRSGKR